MGIFDNVKPLEPGTYKVEITDVLTKVSQEHGTVCIVEMRVLESSCPQFKEGDSISWVQNTLSLE
jgi:hypothetical protein